MYDSKLHDENATRNYELSTELQSFLETSARYFGLDGVPPGLFCRHDYTILDRKTECTENLLLKKRDAA